MGTVSASYANSIYSTCVALGCPETVLSVALGEAPSALNRPAHRFAASGVLRMLEAAEAALNESRIGIYCGQNFRPNTFTDVGYGLLVCASLREALAFNRKYQALTQEIGRTCLDVEGNRARVCFDCGARTPEETRLFVEAVFAGYATLGRWLTLVHDQQIYAMHWRHGRVAHLATNRQVFGCEQVFDAEQNCMELDASLVDRPLPQSNPALVSVLSERLDRMLAEHRSHRTAAREVFQTVQAMLTGQTPTLPRVAETLGVAERTLRRRLEKEGASFRTILEESRREACGIYLSEGRWSMTEISQLLGYSEPSAFSRAFKTWYGVPPSQWSEPGQV